MNALRPKVRSFAIASSTPYVDRACVPSTGTAACAEVVSLHAKSGVGRHAAPACAVVVKKVVEEGMASGIAIVLVVGMLITSGRVNDAESAAETVTDPLGE